MPDIGDRIPALTGTTGAGDTLRLADCKDQWLVLYFYPKDNTPGCTSEAQAFRDLAPELAARQARIIGVSRDSVASHARFADRHGLGFPLIADVDERWCRAFDVIHEKVLYGKRHMGVVRSTFLIGPDGRVRQAWRNVRVPGHAQAVLDALDAARKET
ncbi:MAG: peroxiredoxin [Rhodanobacter sp.]